MERRNGGGLNFFLGAVIGGAVAAVATYFITKENEQETPARNNKQKQRPAMNVDTCAICLEDWTPTLVVLPCGHTFHSKCMERYARKICPMCKEPFVGPM